MYACMLSLSQVAHQLLNGRPAIRGLRRQFSLDQGSNYYVNPAPSKPAISKMPYSEEIFGTAGGEHFVTITPAQVTPEKSSSSIVAAAAAADAHLHQAKSLDSATPSTSNASSSTLADNNDHSSPSSSSKLSRLSPRSIKTFVKSSSLPVVEESTEHTEPK